MISFFSRKKIEFDFGYVLHEYHAGPVLCYLQKQFSKVLPFFFQKNYLPNIIIVVSHGLIVVIQFQCSGNQQKNTNWVESS